jgi:CheY-specific phosphatase CheX
MKEKIEHLLRSSVLEIAQETGLGIPEISLPSPSFSPDTVVNIGIIGDWHGFLFLQAERPPLTRLMKLMLDHLGYSDGDDDPHLYLEAYQELANQTSGRLMMHFAKAGISGDITPPTVLNGSNISMNLSGYAVEVKLCFSFEAGDLIVIVGLKK